MCWWLFLRQNVRIVNLFITNDYLVLSLYFNVSRSSGNSKSNLDSVTSNFGLGLRRFDGTAAQSLRLLKNMILRVTFFWINFNIITRNNCLNKTTLILVVAFLLSVSIFYTVIASLMCLVSLNRLGIKYVLICCILCMYMYVIDM